MEDHGRQIDIPQFTIKDSGERIEFKSGSLRDTTAGKRQWWRVTVGPLMRRLADHLTKGAEKYPDAKPGVPNWSLISTEEEEIRYRDSAFRHFMQWWNKEADEDHFAATVFNMNGVEHIREKRQHENRG